MHVVFFKYTKPFASLWEEPDVQVSVMTLATRPMGVVYLQEGLRLIGRGDDEFLKAAMPPLYHTAVVRQH